MSTPRLSVIVIACNQREFVDLALRSILHDTTADVEVICVDDASTDGTDSVIERWMTEDDRVQLIRHPKVGKPSVLRNVGLAHATAEWISFLDGDDLYHRDRYTILMRAADSARCAPDVIAHDHRVFVDGEAPEHGRVRITAAILEQMQRSIVSLPAADRPLEMRELILDGNLFSVFLLAHAFVLQTATQIIRRSMLVTRRIQFDESVTFGEDHLFILQCVVGSTVLFVQQPLSFYRKHSGSLTAVTTPDSQRELVASVVRQVAVLRRSCRMSMTTTDWSDVRRQLLGEMLHLGYLLECSGRRAAAVGLYLKVCVRDRSLHAGLRALKALVIRARTTPAAVLP